MNILITGASRGIGFEIVKKFAVDKENYIVALSRNKKLLKELSDYCFQKFQNKIHLYSIDFLSDNFQGELTSIFQEQAKHFDIIINNAGLLYNKPFTETSVIDMKNMYQVNVFAPVLIVQTIIPYLNKNELCHIINIGSMGGYQGSVKFPGLSLYSSSKAALANLTECLAEEYKDENIKINCLALGSVQTEMLNEAFPNYQAQVTAEEMAIHIVKFSRNGAKYFNGKVIPISNSTP